MGDTQLRTAKTIPRDHAPEPLTPAGAPCFMERQFPVARVSAESYKERKANYSQTLTGLGKWWGRKPLVLIRAVLLGLLLPATGDAKRDGEIFLKLMTMDEEGLWRRKDKVIPGPRLVEALSEMPPSLRMRFLAEDGSAEAPALRRLSRTERGELQRLAFQRMPYSEKLRYCRRPEQMEGPSEEAWAEINAHLGTDAAGLPELVEELGRRRFGHRPRVGDSFCGAGGVPFEAARLGCDAYGSDLSPVATLLTWAALNLTGGGGEAARRVREAQQEIYDAVDRRVTEWGIEHNEQGWRADAYLYCVEATCPECGRRVPLAPSWVIGEKTRTVAELVPEEEGRGFHIEIHQGVSDSRMKRAGESGTVRNSRLHCPCCGPDRTTEIDTLRRLSKGKDPAARYHESGLRLWENDDLVPRPGDVFQERLYCIRWVETYVERKAKGGPAEKTRRRYRAPTTEDLGREDRVLELLRERFHHWQAEGYIPSRRIEPGAETTRLQRERGWTHWHHLFTPRQLLFHGQLLLSSDMRDLAQGARAATLLGVGRLGNWNAKLSQWDSGIGKELINQAFANQALNTLSSFACKTVLSSTTAWTIRIPTYPVVSSFIVAPQNSAQINAQCDLWITDPPYADAINYHELSEFFLAWYEKHLPKLFPEWYTDSKRALAIKADDPVEFRNGMVACYRRLVEHMPEDGLQVVMFTHQDAAVWADLTMILWAAGLRVTAAWCVATETDSALKEGNYVQGTVLLVCRKRRESEPVFLDEIQHRVEGEVRRQLDEMLALEDDGEPNFADADYQLAAYAAALRVLTERPMEELDPEREIHRARPKGEVGPVERIIRNAVKIACDHLAPRGIDRDTWKTLSPMERFYLKGLEVETHGERRSGVFQELARGFGAARYATLLASSKANQARLKTAGEFGRRMLSGDGFAGSLVRQILFAIHQITRSEETATGLNWLKTEWPDYWNFRERILHILDFLGKLDRVAGMTHWDRDAEAARLLSGAVRNDYV